MLLAVRARAALRGLQPAAGRCCAAAMSTRGAPVPPSDEVDADLAAATVDNASSSDFEEEDLTKVSSARAGGAAASSSSSSSSSAVAAKAGWKQPLFTRQRAESSAPAWKGRGAAARGVAGAEGASNSNSSDAAGAGSGGEEASPAVAALQAELAEKTALLRSKRIADHAAHADAVYAKALAGGGDGAFAGGLGDDADALAEEDDDASGAGTADPGLAVDYCVFCYHGTSFLRHDNVALLTKFVSERGTILPKRFTKCCAKHQRKLADTVKRARWLNLLPYHSKLHPKLRFTSMRPDPILEASPSAGGATLDAVLGGDRDSSLKAAVRSDVDTALKELAAFTAQTKSA